MSHRRNRKLPAPHHGLGSSHPLDGNDQQLLNDTCTSVAYHYHLSMIPENLIDESRNAFPFTFLNTVV